MRKTILTLLLIAAAATVASAQSATNFLVNPGFEIGYSGQRMMDAINSWPPETYPVWDWGRIRSAATTPTHSGTNTFELDAFANYNKVMAQRFKASAGIVYEVEAWMKSPSNSAYFKPTNGFCYAKIEFFNAAGASIGAEDSIAKFRQNGPTNWTTFTTGPVQAPANTVTGKALFGYCPGGDDWGPTGDQTVQGLVYVDDLRAFTNLDHNAGVMSNAGFEVRNGTTYLPLTNMPFWTGLGTDGGGVTNHHRTGQISLQIWGIDSLAGQTWAATRSNKYATSAYIFSTNFTTTNAYAQVILQFLNATNGVIVEYASPRFTSQSPSNTWTQFEAVGVAPSGTVVGRTLCGIVGDPTGFGTSTAWFDDTTQRVVSTTGTMAGLIHNGGFDDGPSGNAYDLALAGDLPWWEWLGGDNGGFVNGSYKTNEQQSLSITYPDNSAGQKFAAVTGRGYIVEGYIYNPAAEDLTGSAFGAYLIEFYRGTSLVSTVDSRHFTNASPSNTWVKFSVTNRAPWSGSITGRVSAGIYGDPTGFGGALYFDAVRVVETNLPTLTNVQAGALWNPGFEYTARGTVLGQIDNWSGLGAAGQVSDLYKRSGNNALNLYYVDNLAVQTWTATQGWKYATAGYAYTPAADRFTSTASGAHGLVMLQFLNATGGVIVTYESSWFTTNIAAGVWTNLEAQGVAPAGTVSGRTVCAIVGATDGLGGSIWFDDLTQRVVSTTGTSSGLLSNPGFEDGPTGNAYDLDLINDLPGWTWMGGTNAGFVTSTYKSEGAQSFSITYPENVVGQMIPMITGRTYIAEGYIYNPSGEKLTGTAYGVVTIDIFRNGTLVSSEESTHFTASSPSNSWVKFSVTNRAPSSGSVSGRVNCAILGSISGFGGALHFDNLTAWETNVVYSNYQAGALWNPGFEYSSPGTPLTALDNWTGYGLGYVLDTYKRSGNNALNLTLPDALAQQDWVATQGWKYASAAFAYTAVGDKMTGTAVHASVLLQFLDASSNTLISYESAWFGTSATAGTWSNLEVIGVAPKGTRYGRTVVGLFGSTNSYSGSVWFDDATQRVVSTTGSVAGVLRNPGFDDGPSGNSYNLQATNDLPNWKWIGGTNAGFVARDFKLDAEQALSITYPDNLAVQTFTTVTGRDYVVQGYIYTPSSSKLTGSAYGTLLLEFYNGSYNSGTSVVSVVEALHFTSANAADTWTKFCVTNRAPWLGAVTGRVIAAVLGNPSGFGGAVYFDGLSVTAKESSVVNTQAGTLWNPGFEYTARGTVLAQLDSWSVDGQSGLVSDSYKHGGNNALQIYYPGTLAHQTWDATQGWRYASSAYAYTPSADRLAGASSLHGVVLLEFLDATGTNVLQTYESTSFTTGSVADTWTALEASGIAPSGTRYGRTSLALVGDTAGYAGSLWFDDASQSLVSTTGTVAGLLHNPGFDDGPPGNAYDLDVGSNLPYWDWLGGTNGGYVATSYYKDSPQSLVITWPGNLIGQSLSVNSGYTYVYQGYLYTPAAGRMTGSAYGVLSMEFYSGTTLVSVVDSEHFTASSPSNTWVKFAVTNRAPWSGSITSRVLCSISGSSESFGGTVYFDNLIVTGSYVGATNAQAGALQNPGFEYTANGTTLEFIDSWTALGNAGVVAETYKRSGKNALKLYAPETLLAQTWSATQGWKYASAAYAYTPAADRLRGDPNLHGVVLLQFLDATGTNILQTYESTWFTTNLAASAWTNLEAIGVAPKGTRYGRTVLGLLGTNTGFSGSLWFDDATQRVASTGGTTNGLLRNPGFDDGPSGNVYDLYATNDFPSWIWIGGTNSGFVARDYKKDAEQALVITYPLNSAAQEWTAGSDKRYKAEGYLLTPSAAKFTSDGDVSFGRLELAFYVNGSSTPETNFVSAAFGSGQPADTWVYFAVTGRAPAGVSVTGRVTCTIYSPNPSNDLDLAGVIYFDQLSLSEITNTADSDLVLTKVGTPSPVRVGEALTYSLAISNKGPDEAEGVVLSDLLPAEVNFSTCHVSQGSWSYAEGEVACSLGTLANGATAAVTIVVLPILDGWITNAASVGSDSTDPVTSDNRASAVVQVLAMNRAPEITLPGPHTMTVGRSTNFVVTVSDADHDSVTLTNTLRPSGATFVTSNFSWTATSAFAGTTNVIVFVANDGQGLTNSVVTNSTTITVLFDADTDGMSDGWEWTQFGNLTNSGSADNDGDSENNYREYVANTQPTNAQSYFRSRDVATAVGTSNHQVRVYTEPQRKYTIYYSSGALSNNMSWTPFANTNWGVWLETASSSTNHIFTDNESTNTGGALSSGARRYYRVKVSFP